MGDDKLYITYYTTVLYNILYNSTMVYYTII